jgi:hypothetical protein
MYATKNDLSEPLFVEQHPTFEPSLDVSPRW